MSDRETGRIDPLHAADSRDGEDAPAFRVIDRRRFAPDGSERDEDTPNEQPSAQPRAAAQPEHPTAAPSAPTGEAESDPELAMPHGEPYEERPGAPFEPSFGTLLISLSTQALMHLGEIPDLEGGEAHRDLAAARHIIDLIAVLERKTQGNLDADEAALLERILYDLRMRFVAISRG
ncbi:DUF1844 domain-containing protein [Candidatus Binatia bacterium]|jgi:hypothetical protein|nr:DUF1844 domain-containing protein [Candidatus Binatia bacterium]